MNEADFRIELANRGYAEPELVERPGGTFNAEHEHDFAAYLLILDGEITVSTATASTTCRAGDTFELAPGIVHTERYGPDGARILAGRRFD